jgi:hypothetical protein
VERSRGALLLRRGFSYTNANGGQASQRKHNGQQECLKRHTELRSHGVSTVRFFSASFCSRSASRRCNTTHNQTQIMAISPGNEIQID